MFWFFLKGDAELMKTTSCTYRLGRPQAFYLLSRCDQLAASTASRVLVNQHPSLCVINTRVEEASLHSERIHNILRPVLVYLVPQS